MCGAGGVVKAVPSETGSVGAAPWALCKKKLVVHKQKDLTLEYS